MELVKWLGVVVACVLRKEEKFLFCFMVAGDSTQGLTNATQALH